MTVPYEESPETGRICYEALGDALRWKFQGAALPRWADLEPQERDAFGVAAHQVIQKGWKQAQPTVSAARHARH
jgi:hypothetical protein